MALETDILLRQNKDTSTRSMEKSPCWVPDIPSKVLLRVTKVHYRKHEFDTKICPESDEPSRYTHTLQLCSILILSNHLGVCLPSYFFPPNLQTRIIYALFLSPCMLRRRDNSVGLATRLGLHGRAKAISLIHRVQIGSGAHAVSYLMGAETSFLGVKCLRHETDHTCI
jgi:hypothetical protein